MQKFYVCGFCDLFIFFGLERVNFLQGQASFGLTLELIGCSIFLLFYFFCDVIPKMKIQLYNELSNYAKIMLAFIATVLLSVFFSADFALSARRLVLLSVYILSGLFSVNYLIIKYPDKIMNMVVNGMVVLSIIYAICSIYDVLVWFDLGLASKMSALFPFFKSNIWSIGSTFVRARGASEDPNRAGIFMIVNSYIILKYCKKPALKIAICSINVMVLVLTLSRTALLCFALYIILQSVALNRFKISKKLLFRVTIVVFLIIVIAISLFQVPIIQEALSHTIDRIHTRDASADDHILFIQSGVSLVFSNLKVLLVGNGYGASYTILGQGKMSNFHNAFVSFLVECGIFSLILFILLLLYPLQKNRSNFPIIAVLILANIPYQIYIEPYFWFILPFLCIAS